MSVDISQSNDWVQLQANVFTRWVQNQLKGYPDVHVEKITKDLSNGVALVDLAKTLTHKDAPRNWSMTPKRTVDMVQNCDLAVDMFMKDGVDLVGISGKDINDNNEKLILGLIWSLILHYSIGQSVQTNHDNTKKNSKEDLQTKAKNEIKVLKSWAIDRTENYPNIHNFSPYELSMCALLDSYVPNKINYYSLNPNDTENNSKLATNVMNDLGIPILIYPEDVKNINSKIDDKTLLTQLSCMKSVLENSASHILSKDVNKKDEKSDVESDSDDEELHDDSVMPTYPTSNEANKTDSVEQQKDLELRQKDPELNKMDHNQNNDNYQLTDHLLDKESILDVDSRNEPVINVNDNYERLHENDEQVSPFRRFLQRVIDSIVRFFNQPQQNGPMPRVRGYIINSPIIPYVYSVDYSQP